MGNQGTADPGFRRGVELDPRRRHRRGERGPRLDQSPVQVLEAGAGHRRADPRRRPRSRARPLGPVPRAGSRAALQPGLSSPRLARLVGLRHRRAGRHGLPHDQPAVHGACSSACPTQVSAQSGEINSETYPAWATITYEFPARGNLPAGQGHLVRRRQGRQAQPAARPISSPRSFKPSDSGSLIIGSNGEMYSPSDYGAEQVLWPTGEYKDIKAPERNLAPASRAAATSTRTRRASGSRPSSGQAASPCRTSTIRRP